MSWALSFTGSTEGLSGAHELAVEERIEAQARAFAATLEGLRFASATFATLGDVELVAGAGEEEEG